MTTPTSPYLKGDHFDVERYRAVDPQPSLAEINARLWAEEGKSELGWGQHGQIKGAKDLAERLGLTLDAEQLATAAKVDLATATAYLDGTTYEHGAKHPKAAHAHDVAHGQWLRRLTRALIDAYAPGLCQSDDDVTVIMEATSSLHSCWGDNCCRDYYQHWSSTAQEIIELARHFRPATKEDPHADQDVECDSAR